MSGNISLRFTGRPLRGATIFERVSLRECALRERFLEVPDRRVAMSAYRVWIQVRDFLNLYRSPIDTQDSLHYKRDRARVFFQHTF